ncbi:MAG: DUF1570 domain-containing protein [Planctomycetaceae bacterium]
MLEERDGYLLNIIPDAIISQEETAEIFRYADRTEIATELISELGTGFSAYQTENYLLISEMSADYTDWVGTLLEQVYSQFFKEWKSPDLKIEKPSAPLVILLFADRDKFNRYIETELLQETLPNQGFYSVRTNRVVLIDMAEGKSWIETRNSRVGEQALGNALLNTSTIAHEGVHQLCYNCGMFVRFADTPLWVSEGIALYFETPSLRSRTGWGGTGRINNNRLFQFRDFQKMDRPEDSLTQLISSNKLLSRKRQRWLPMRNPGYSPAIY